VLRVEKHLINSLVGEYLVFLAVLKFESSIRKVNNSDMAFDRESIKTELSKLASQGIFVGTSSWKYPGWRGILYDEARYVWRGKFAESRFEKNCLTEYGEVFKAVGVDAAYYTFPSVKYLEGMALQVPSDFQFAFKVTDTITLKKFPNLPRFGSRAGSENELFLNAGVFERLFLQPCETIRPHVGLLMFEFSRFYPGDFAHGRDFVEALDCFLGKLPKGWPYGVEIRNQTWLKPEYFECLARHQVTHVFNSWTEMPPVPEQMALPGAQTNPDLTAARFLLRPGRKYEEAVKAFAPYDRTQEINEDSRRAGAALIKEAKIKKKKRTFILVNNRLEGNALQTIAAMLDMAAGDVVNNSLLTNEAATVQTYSNGKIDQKTGDGSQVH
jgi:uncharacterized protein YecE (DUF72 family)